MLKLVRYLKGYEKQCICAPLFKMLEAAFNLLVPLVMASVIDDGIAKGDISHVYFCAVLLIGMAIIGWVCSVTAQYFCAQLASGFGTALRDDLFAHIMTLSSADIEELGSSTLVTRLTNDSNQVQDGVNMFFRLVLRAPIVVFGAIISAFIVSGVEGVLFLVISALVFLFVRLVMSVAVKRFRVVQTTLDSVLLKVTEQLEGVRVLRAFSQEKPECESFESTISELRANQVSAGDVSALMNPLTYVAVNLGLAAVLYVGGIQVQIGAFSQGELVALVNYLSQLLTDLLRFATLITSLSKSEACAKRVNEIFARFSTMEDGSKDATTMLPLLSVDHVSFTYPNTNSPALTDITFEAQPGEVIGVIGGTGSGKSTLAALLMHTYDVSSGSIKLDSEDIRNFTRASLHKQISIVDQKPSLFAGTIATNLKIANQNASDEELEQAIDIAQATNVVEAKGGLPGQIEQLGRNLSGGQKQRLSIARTLVRKPHILILDDASSALDLATDAALRHALKEQLSDTTQIVISQRVSALAHADAILVLDHGRLVGKGTHDELRQKCRVYKEICASQLSQEVEHE